MINLIIGIMIGGLIGVCFMCCFQINRDNELQNRVNAVIDWINKLLKTDDDEHDIRAILVITKYLLVGDVDDE